jgi:uncharacterized protein (TIGR02646 family)
MRKLAKGPLPNVLAANGLRWRNELLAVLARGDKPTDTLRGRYRNPEVKQALIAETHGKCAYCESKIRHIAHGDIEHVRPKSKAPELAYEWDNLTLACDVCNENKGDYVSSNDAENDDTLIDPYADNPADHFLFLREVVFPRPDSPRARLTDQRIKLSRLELVERRRERMDFIDGLVAAISLAKDEFRDILVEDLVTRHLGDDKEYAAVATAYVELLQQRGALPEL